MKKSCDFSETFPVKTSKKVKKGNDKFLTPKFKRSSTSLMKRYGLPPMAPHNTTEDIINFHPVLLFDEEDLLGSNSNLLNSFA